MTARKAALEALDQVTDCLPFADREQWQKQNIATIRVFIEGAEADPHAYLWSDGKIHATPQGTLQAENTPADAEREELAKRLQAFVDCFAADDEGLVLQAGTWNAVRADLAMAVRVLRSAPSSAPRAEPVAWLHSYRKPGHGYTIADIGPDGPDPREGYTHFQREPLYAAAPKPEER